MHVARESTVVPGAVSDKLTSRYKLIKLSKPKTFKINKPSKIWYNILITKSFKMFHVKHLFLHLISKRRLWRADIQRKA